MTIILVIYYDSDKVTELVRGALTNVLLVVKLDKMLFMAFPILSDYLL